MTSMASPRWRIEIFKTLGVETWANTYLTDDNTIDDAQDLAQSLITWEQHIHMAVINFDYALVSSYGAGRVFRHYVINEPGLYDNLAYIPLFNTVRIDMGTDDADPARKYYRCPVAEANQNEGLLESTYISALNSLITTYLVTPGVLGHLVTTKGNTVVNAVVHPQVQMRQQHRRRKKKVLP